jgi:amino acid transporter
MGTLATYGFMLAYALVCIAAPIFLRRRGESPTWAMLLGGLGVLTMAFVFYVSWVPQLIPNDIFAALTWPLWILPYVFLAWAAVGLVWYFTVKRSRPEVIASAGRWGDHPEPEISASTIG